MVNYQNGKIYKLVNNVDDEIYIGSTCNPLSKRKGSHKTDSKREKCKNMTVYLHLNNIGWENVEIILIETCSCENKDELHKRERYWIETLKSSLNKVLPGRTRKERMESTNYNKIYYEQHKEQLLVKGREYSKKYRQENKTLISEKYDANRKKIAEKKKIKITCECGSTFRKDGNAEHKKTQKHKDYLETLNQ